MRNSVELAQLPRPGKVSQRRAADCLEWIESEAINWEELLRSSGMMRDSTFRLRTQHRAGCCFADIAAVNDQQMRKDDPVLLRHQFD